MEKKREISEYRERLDKTLASPELSDKQKLKTLIRNQLNEESNEDILDQRVSDLSNILEKLRSASTKDQNLSKSTHEAISPSDWKVKHDHEDCRVMYREGLEGSPFHTLLVEGYMDGPIEDCLCVSWELPLYEKWWPKSTFPAFRILQTQCLQQSRIDEQICSVRMKVPWPMTNREAIVKYFLFQYFKDGLVIILLNSISSPEVESINKSELAEAVNVVRVDLVGAVAIQKVNPERSYLRYIAEFDIKLDFIPPSLINFMSRQLLGNGFRLFKKTIGSVANSNDYRSVLAYPLYTQIREALYSTNRIDESKASELHSQEGRHCEDIVLCKRDEIEEEECVSSSEIDENVIGNTQNKNGRTRFCISPEVKQALGTLERVISMVRKSRTYNINTLSFSEEEEEEESSPKQHSERTEIVSTSKVCIQDPTIEVVEEASLTLFRNSNRHSGSSSFAREGNKVAHASPEINLTTNSEVPRITISEATTLFSQTEDDVNEKPSGINEGKSSILQRKPKPGCFGFKSWMRKT